MFQMCLGLPFRYHISAKCNDNNDVIDDDHDDDGDDHNDIDIDGDDHSDNENYREDENTKKVK